MIVNLFQLIMFLATKSISLFISALWMILDEGVEQTGLAWLYSDVMYSVLKAMAKLGLIMAYFFVCDR